MQKSKPEILIQELIRAKEAEQRAEGKILKEHLLRAYENLKPINVLRNTLKEAISSAATPTNPISAIIGSAGRFIAKQLFANKADKS